jgi:hypothetical protein
MMKIASFVLISTSLMACATMTPVAAFSAYSSFTGSTTSKKTFATTRRKMMGGMTMYDTSRDAPNNPEQNAWSVLASTEKWIASTLEKNNALANAAPSPTINNPYARKEVSYVCETNKESSMIVAGIFRMLREAREQGETHGVEEEERAEQIGKCQS